MGVWSSLASGLLLLAAPLDARTTRGWSDDRVIEALRSVEPREVAWGAHEAGLRHLKRAVPPLLDVLESPPSWPVSHVVLEHTLDALIQLGAELEPSHLSPLPTGDPFISRLRLILLARTPGRFEAALLADLDAKPRGASFHAVAGLLTQIRSRGLAERLLPMLSTTLTVTVHSPGRMVWSGRGWGCGGAVAYGRGERRAAGLPPAFDYELELERDHRLEEGERVFPVVSSLEAVVALRLERSPRRHPSGFAVGHREALPYLAHLAGLPRKGLGIPAQRQVRVEFHDERQVAEFIEGARRKILDAHDRLRERLATQGLLERARMRRTELALELVIQDLRGDGAAPLSF